MKSKALHILTACLLVLPLSVRAGSIPISISAKGGVGTANFAMDGINDQLSLLRQTYGGNSSALDGGFNVYLEARVWMFGRVAALIGFEHYWAETDLTTPSDSYIFKAPTNVLLLGGAVTVLQFPKLVDINLGARGSFAKVTFGTNEIDVSGNLDEYKNNSYGWDIFAEVNANFLRPVEVGIMVGYRNLTIDGLEDKFGDIAYHVDSGKEVELDYSGTFIYITAGFRLW